MLILRPGAIARILPGALLLAFACGQAPPPRPMDDTSPSVIAVADAADAPVVDVPADAPAADAPAVESDDSEDDLATCSRDAQCGWDDDCVPKRCIAASSQGPMDCGKSSPPPGTCTCSNGFCMLKPLAAPPPSAPGCASNADCVIDRAAARCRIGKSNAWPLYEQGPLCRCDAASSTCRFEWHGPVACKTWRDCSWVEDPLRPVPASQVPRPVRRRVRPCKDSEVDSVCDPDTKMCRIESWRC